MSRQSIVSVLTPLQGATYRFLTKDAEPLLVEMLDALLGELVMGGARETSSFSASDEVDVKPVEAGPVAIDWDKEFRDAGTPEPVLEMSIGAAPGAAEEIYKASLEVTAEPTAPREIFLGKTVANYSDDTPDEEGIEGPELGVFPTLPLTPEEKIQYVRVKAKNPSLDHAQVLEAIGIQPERAKQIKPQSAGRLGTIAKDYAALKSPASQQAFLGEQLARFKEIEKAAK